MIREMQTIEQLLNELDTMENDEGYQETSRAISTQELAFFQIVKVPTDKTIVITSEATLSEEDKKEDWVLSTGHGVVGGHVVFKKGYPYAGWLWDSQGGMFKTFGYCVEGFRNFEGTNNYALTEMEPKEDVGFSEIS